MAAIRPPYVKVICPTAESMSVTLNAGFVMPSWFDLISLDPNGPEDRAGIEKATNFVHGLIEEELKNGIEASRIAVGGFSQGGGLAIHAALQYPKSLAGIIGLSCWLPLHKDFPKEAKGNLTTRLFQAHGSADPVVPFHWGAETSALLKQFMENSEFKTYPGLSHSSGEQEMEDVKKFLQEVLPDN
ncbi:unnamed protein product [Darwinula stevensoni]|nr:unnamed protein product [Darwinula stevensoni]CAG0883394.1 unnamed protein product [Darwinula stevensoni]